MSVSVNGEGDKGCRIGGRLFMDLFYLFGARYQLGHCPVSCSSCNTDFICMYFILFCFISLIYST